MYSYGPPHMAEQKQDDQLEHTYSSSVRIRDVALKTCQRRWTIGRSGKSGAAISVLAARHDDDDEMSNSSIWPIDRTLSGAINSGQSEPGNNNNEGVFHIPQSSYISASPSDCLVSYPGHSLQGRVLQLPPANWAKDSTLIIHSYLDFLYICLIFFLFAYCPIKYKSFLNRSIWPIDDPHRYLNFKTVWTWE